MTGDMIEYLGKLHRHLRAMSSGQLPYGAFDIYQVWVEFEGEPVGRFVFRDDQWMWEAT